MTVGENIRRIRKEKGLTQKKLGELCEINEVQIRQYELKKANPKIGTINKIATALEVKVADIMGISDYLDAVETEVKRTTNFYDYLEILGYKIGDSEHEVQQMHILESNIFIDLTESDMNLLKELEDSTNKDIKRTIELLIATKGISSK